MNSILLISSNRDSLATLSNLLSKRGYRVIAKSSAGSAISILQQGENIDVVISDYLMPDMDSAHFFTSLKRVKADLLPVIFLSDSVSVKDYLNALSLGAFEFLFRPVNPQEFLRIVAVAIQRGADLNSNDTGTQRESAARTFFPNGSPASVASPLYE